MLSMVSFDLLAPPAILKMLGKTKLEKPTVLDEASHKAIVVDPFNCLVGCDACAGV